MGLPTCLVQVSAEQLGRIAGAGGVHVEVLEFSGKDLLHRDVVKCGGARPVPLCVGLHLREGLLDLVSGCTPMLSVLVTLFVVHAFFHFSASARVDMGSVHRVGFRHTAKAQLDPHPAAVRLRQSGAAYGV